MPLPSFSLGKDTGVCVKNYLLQVPVTFESYKWSTNETSQQIYINEAGIYSVTVSDANGCVNKDEIIISDSCFTTFYIPNAFTPNGDNTNDVFKMTASNVT